MGLSIDIRKHFPGGKDHDQTTHGNWARGAAAFRPTEKGSPFRESMREFRKEFNALPDDAQVIVYHATTKERAKQIAEGGLRLADKPMTLPRRRYEAGEPATFAPGAGVSGGTYVSANLYDVEGYGNSILAIKVPKKDLAVPPEGGDLPLDLVLMSHDGAVITSDIPASDIVNLYPEHRTHVPQFPPEKVFEAIGQSFAKHSPGGHDHDQSTHGDRDGASVFRGSHVEDIPATRSQSLEGEASNRRTAQERLKLGKPLYRGMGVVLPPEVLAEVEPLLGPAMEEDQIGQQYKAAEIILDYLTEQGIGRHWTTNRRWAGIAADRRGGVGFDPKQWNIIVEIEPPGPEYLADAQDDRGVRGEEEVTLKPDAKYKYIGLWVQGGTWWDNQNLIQTPIVKHYPGGKDHDQKNHGRRGRGLGISPGDGEITDDTMIRVKPSSLSIDPKGGEFIQRRPQPAVAPIMKGPFHFTSTPYTMQVGDTLNDKQLAFVEYGKAHPIEAMRRLGEHFDSLGDLNDTNIDRGGKFLNEAQATEVVMSKIAEVSAVDAYIERGRSILAEIKESGVGDSGIHTYPRVDGSGFVNPIPKSPAEASWGEFVEWASSEHPEHAEALEALTERVEAWKESRGGEQDMMNFRRSVIDASSERGVGDHVERYDIPVGLISVEGTGDRDGLRGVMDSHIESDRIVRDLTGPSAAFEEHRGPSDPPVYNKKTDEYAPLSEFKFFVDGGVVNVGAVVLNEDQVDALVMKGWEVKGAPTGSMYSNPKRIYVARGPDFAQRYGPYGPDAGLPEGTYFTEIRSVQSVELHLARGKSIYELGPLSPRFVTDTKGELDTMATRFRRAKLLGEDIGPQRLKGTISISPRQYTDLLYDEAQRVHTRTNSTLSSIDRDYNEIRGTMLQSRSQEQVVIEALSKHRPMGGQLDLINKRSTDAVRTVNLAAAAYPTDWIERSNKSGQIYVAGKRGARAQYDNVKFDKGTFSFRSEILVDPSHPMADDALHEMGHRFEHVIPELRAAEQAFFRRRTKGDKKVLIPFTRNEKAYPDKFPVLYMGKEYGSPLIRNQQSHKRYTSNEAYELFTTGYPIITGRGKLGMYGSQDLTVYPDSWDEHQAFILGVLATI